jgi:uncharacterized protein (TIGR02300 family)
MARAEMGEKRRCLSCNTAFFDLNRAPVVCPKCAQVFQVVEPVRSSLRKPGSFQSQTRFRFPSAESTVDTLAKDEDEGEESATQDSESPGVDEIEEIS